MTPNHPNEGTENIVLDARVDHSSEDPAVQDISEEIRDGVYDIYSVADEDEDEDFLEGGRGPSMGFMD